uniref:Uncharacterized protein n=1 Tax=Rhizophora mucronata TaxID=61149 RepID=A0A2P2NJ41_RHIMU
MLSCHFMVHLLRVSNLRRKFCSNLLPLSLS